MPNHTKHFCRPCDLCGFIFKPRNAFQRFCSISCKGAAATLAARSVATCKRGHPRAENRRQNGTCRACRSEDQRAATLAKGKRPKNLPSCIRGHALTTDNLKGGTRKGGCLTCHRERERTKRGNQARGSRPVRTHCSAGHLLTPETRRKGHRHQGECLICHRLRERKIWDKQARKYAHVLCGDPCSYCGEQGGTLDHIVPKKSGGTDAWDNLTAACFSCNAQKQAQGLLWFLYTRGEACTAKELRVIA
jgi:HNH endonuclease